ncbi:helix-turn-helix domain-containing protein [Paenibacillus thiaminolyticus]|uniref:helix-turn-helix domain-containing protein n=1 Tax=Paenibacillus thiaminolyticus TaxID=49283 RepID=UPI002543AB63|nr:helix-turn-helix domain-containing protein [Paenibacillus thiaminolyticus]WII37985.1 helix-turn-helix domain-containing protein [Paenibacillus thiaminolyticus]
MTQEGLAVKVNTTKGTISNYENGHSTPPNESLVAIADVLVTTTDYLLGRTDDPLPPKTVENDDSEPDELLINHVHGAFFKDYLSAPEKKKEEMRQFLKFILQQEKNRKPGQKQGE